MSTTRTWKPTNKWLAAQCTAVSAVAISWVNAGAWSRSLTAASIGVVAQATAAYLVTNADPSTGPTSQDEPASAPPGGLVPPAGVRSTAA